MKHMIIATAVLILSLVVLIIGATIIFWPMEYTADALIDNYPSGSICGDSSEISGTMTFLVYCVLAAFVFGIVLLFIWYFGYAHKFEYEQD